MTCKDCKTKPEERDKIKREIIEDMYNTIYALEDFCNLAEVIPGIFQAINEGKIRHVSIIVKNGGCSNGM